MILKKCGHFCITCTLLAYWEFYLVTSLELKLEKLVSVRSLNSVLEKNFLWVGWYHDAILFEVSIENASVVEEVWVPFLSYGLEGKIF